MTAPITAEQLQDAANIIAPKGSQPADDTPVAVVTLYRSSFVMSITHHEVFDPTAPAHRQWFAERCQQAADAMSNLDDGENSNIILTAPDTLIDLGDAIEAADVPAILQPSEALIPLTGGRKILVDAEGQDTPQAAADRTHFEVYDSTDGWRWRLRAGNGEPIASGEAYASKRAALHALTLIAAVDDETPIEKLE